MSCLTALFAPVSREFDIFLGFSWRDWSASIIPGSIFAVGAMRYANLPLLSIPFKYLLLLSWLTPYVYFFNLSNQITGVDEDRINKPDRPIPAGTVTLEGAKWRWVIALSAFLLVAAFKPNLLPETIGWVLTVAFLCLTSVGSHWFGKNTVAMATGTWSLLNASWKVIVPLTPRSQRFVIAVSAWAGLLTQIQDLRDMKGDAAVGRKTMPLVFGEKATRWIIALLLLPASIWVLWIGDIVPIAPKTLTAVHVFLGYRLLNARGSRYDHKTYMVSPLYFISFFDQAKHDTDLHLYLLFDPHVHCGG
jgi:4-hydroxybenzoate polyprenyltransferase